MKRSLPNEKSAETGGSAKKTRTAPTDKEEKIPSTANPPAGDQNPQPMDTDSRKEVSPLEIKYSNKIHAIFDLDECTVIPINESPPLSPEKAQVIELFKKNNLYIEAFIPHLVLPGVVELIRLLDSMPNAAIHFFSAGAKERVELLVEKLLCLYLGKTRYEAIKSRIIIKSKNDLKRSIAAESEEQYKKYGFKQGDYVKDISLIIGGKEIESVVHIDDDRSFLYQVKNCILTHTCQCTVITLAYQHFKESKFTLLERDFSRINSIFYATGILFSALNLAEKEKISVVEALVRIQYIKNPPDSELKFNYPYEHTKQFFYDGLKILRQINPKLNFIDKEHFLNEEPMQTQTSTNKIAASLPPPPDVRPMDVDSSAAAQPAEVKAVNELIVSFDIDRCIAVPIQFSPPAWPSLSALFEIFKKNNLYIDASFPHLVLPGTLELIKLLDSLPNIVIHFFSRGSKRRNELFVEKLLCASLGDPRYLAMKSKVIVKSKDDLTPKDPEKAKKQQEKYGIPQNDSIKDLTLIDSKKIERIIHLDDKETCVHPIENCLRVPRCDIKAPETMYIHFKNSDHDAAKEYFSSMNTVFYATGVLFSAIDLAEQKKISVRDALTEIQYEKNPSDSTMRFKELHGDKAYFVKGLNLLRKINPRLQLVDEKTFFDEKTVRQETLEQADLEISKIIAAEKEKIFSDLLTQLINRECPEEEAKKIKNEVQARTNPSDKTKKMLKETEELWNEIEKRTREKMIKEVNDKLDENKNAKKVEGNAAEKPKSPTPGKKIN